MLTTDAADKKPQTGEKIEAGACPRALRARMAAEKKRCERAAMKQVEERLTENEQLQAGRNGENDAKNEGEKGESSESDE
jgi:hypothetical protein